MSAKQHKAHAEPVTEELDDSAEASAPEPAEHPAITSLKRDVAERDVRIADLDAQVRHYAQSYDKARTEFTATQERQKREAERNAAREKVKLVGGLLGVLDSLDLSLQSVKSGEPTRAFVDGVQLIRTQFEGALSGLGLQRFDGVGEIFDPNRHQAVTSMPVTDPAQAGRVIHSVAAGVLVGDEVVRAATVVVGAGSAGETH